ncbi:hypothetical protein IG631_22147 [Alternaria alternata]|nr:hypothetical protein IG631_22147 [Alternaria alternata]
MGRQSVDPSQYVKSYECTIKKPDGRLRFESRGDSISIDRHDLTQTEWESCVPSMVASTDESHDGPLTLQDDSNGFSFLLLCPTSEEDIYERVGIFHVWLQHASSRISYQSDNRTPDWNEERCDDGYASEELDSIDDLLMVGLTMTYDTRQGLYKSREDEAEDYDFGEDPNRLTEEPDEEFDDSFVFPRGFPDWETRVSIVR